MSIDANSPDVSILHAEVIAKKSFLKRFYEEIYRFFYSQSLTLPPGISIELGSGGGFIKKFLPSVLTSDVVPIPGVDCVFSAHELPFANGSINSIYMVDVLHHLPDVEKFLGEADRCLCSGGRIVMSEPANTRFARFIFQNFHHEVFDPAQAEWAFPSTIPKGRLSGANGALPWIIFKRDSEKFGLKFQNFRIELFQEHSPFLYLLSGGLTLPQLLPSFCCGMVCQIERLFSRFNSELGMFVKIVVVKK